MDSTITIRETPAWKVREQMVRIRNWVVQQNNDAQLAVHHHYENFDESLSPIVPKEKPLGKLTFLYEQFTVWFCCNFHRQIPKYTHGDHFYSCACGRKFAVPWADMNRIPKGTYYQTFEPSTKAQTVQTECRGAHAQIVEAQ